MACTAWQRGVYKRLMAYSARYGRDREGSSTAAPTSADRHVKRGSRTEDQRSAVGGGTDRGYRNVKSRILAEVASGRHCSDIPSDSNKTVRPTKSNPLHPTAFLSEDSSRARSGLFVIPHFVLFCACVAGYRRLMDGLGADSYTIPNPVKGGMCGQGVWMGRTDGYMRRVGLRMRNAVFVQIVLQGRRSSPPLRIFVPANAALCCSFCIVHLPPSPVLASLGRHWCLKTTYRQPTVRSNKIATLTAEEESRSSCCAGKPRQPTSLCQLPSPPPTRWYARLTAKKAMLVTTLLFSGFVTSLTRYFAYPFCCAGRPRPPPPIARPLGGIVVACESGVDVGLDITSEMRSRCEAVATGPKKSMEASPGLAVAAPMMDGTSIACCLWRSTCIFTTNHLPSLPLHNTTTTPTSPTLLE